MSVFLVFVVRIFLHSDWNLVQMPENKDQKNCEYGHFLENHAVFFIGQNL